MSLDLSGLNSVFSLDEAMQALGRHSSKLATVDYLKYYLKTQRLKLVTREIYAVVPPGIDPIQFDPDVFLVAATVRRDALIAHHGALELLGVAHSIWHEYAVWTQRKRATLSLGNSSIRFVTDPQPAWSQCDRLLGSKTVARQGRLLRVTGPERTLVEGFRRPADVGGVEELVQSASGFPILDLSLLESLLTVYKTTKLWAAVGWFLELHQKTFYVPDEFLDQCSRHKPKSPQYMIHNHRGGVLNKRWNLILPGDMVSGSRRHGL
jgi:hypothetical protein